MRKPNPCKYFLDEVLKQQENISSDEEHFTQRTENVNSEVETDAVSIDTQDQHEIHTDENPLPLQDQEIVFTQPRSLRPRRTIIPPLRFRDENFIKSDLNCTESSSEPNQQLKVKRFLAQKVENGKKLYLAHLVGEPAQHAIWLQYDQLGPKAKIKLQSRTPPSVT